MTAAEKLRKHRTDLYQDAVLRWLIAKKQYGYMNHPEPTPAEYQLEDWYAARLKKQVVEEFNRTQ